MPRWLGLHSALCEKPQGRAFREGASSAGGVDVLLCALS